MKNLELLKTVGQTLGREAVVIAVKSSGITNLLLLFTIANGDNLNNGVGAFFVMLCILPTTKCSGIIFLNDEGNVLLLFTVTPSPLF